MIFFFITIYSITITQKYFTQYHIKENYFKNAKIAIFLSKLEKSISEKKKKICETSSYKYSYVATNSSFERFSIICYVCVCVCTWHMNMIFIKYLFVGQIFFFKCQNINAISMFQHFFSRTLLNCRFKVRL